MTDAQRADLEVRGHEVPLRGFVTALRAATVITHADDAMGSINVGVAFDGNLVGSLYDERICHEQTLRGQEMYQHSKAAKLLWARTLIDMAPNQLIPPNLFENP